MGITCHLADVNGPSGSVSFQASVESVHFDGAARGFYVGGSLKARNIDGAASGAKFGARFGGHFDFKVDGTAVRPPELMFAPGGHARQSRAAGKTEIILAGKIIPHGSDYNVHTRSRSAGYADASHVGFEIQLASGRQRQVLLNPRLRPGWPDCREQQQS